MIVPRTIIHRQSAQTGASTASSEPSSEHGRSERVEREAPPRLQHGPEDRCHPERQARERERIAARGLVLPREVVRRERARGQEARDDADGVEPDVLPHLAHEHEPGKRQRERGPDPAAHGLVPDEPRPQRDEHGGGELEQEPDPDRQPLDRDEVEPLDEREADDAVEDEQRELVACDPEPAGRRDEDERRQAEERPGRAKLGQPQVRDPALGEDDLRDRAVDREERRGRGHHRVTEPRVRRTGRPRAVEGDLGHRRNLAAHASTAGRTDDVRPRV